MGDLLWRAALAAVLCIGVGESYIRVPLETPAPPTPPAEEPFADISFGERWYDGAQYGYRKGLVKGMTETEFGGELTATRAMTATMVWRMAGEPEMLGRSRFLDIEPDRYYTVAVLWGETRGLWEGYGDGTFRPGEGVTWGQLELVLERYLGENGERAENAVRTVPVRPETDRRMNRGELAQTLMELCEKRRPDPSG